MNNQQFQKHWHNVLKYVSNLRNFSQKLPKINWRALLKRYCPVGGERTFKSEVGVSPNVLDYLYWVHLYPKKLLPEHLLFTCSFLRKYNSIDSSHGWFNVGYKKFIFHIEKVIVILDKLDFIKWEWVFLDETWEINGKLVVGDIDSTEFCVNAPSTNGERVQIYSGKEKDFTFKYEIVCTLFVGYVLSVCGAFDGPTSDQTIVKISKIEDKIQDLFQFYGRNVFVLGDGHYTSLRNILSRIDFKNDFDRYLYHQKRSKIENINAQVKKFNVLSNRFRHRRGKSLDVKKNFHAKLVKISCNIWNLEKLLK